MVPLFGKILSSTEIVSTHVVTTLPNLCRNLIKQIAAIASSKANMKLDTLHATNAGIGFLDKELCLFVDDRLL